MVKDWQNSAHAYYATNEKKASNAGWIALLIFAILGLAALGAFFAYRFSLVQASYADRESSSSAVVETTSGAPSAVADKNASSASASAASMSSSSGVPLEDPIAAEEGFPTPLVAQYQDVLFHSPIKPSDINGILFHQASFEYALPITSEIPEADPAEIEATKDYQIAAEQPTGDEYLNARALHLWREGEITALDTSVDVGAEAGTQVYAPVTGTVVLVNTYMLYDICEDYEVHIQPDGHPELDVVEIHITDVQVKTGDRVIGGVTPLAKVRNLAAENISDIQLAYYTQAGHGNHTHVQVNNADYPEYRNVRLKDAIKVS